MSAKICRHYRLRDRERFQLKITKILQTKIGCKSLFQYYFHNINCGIVNRILKQKVIFAGAPFYQLCQKFLQTLEHKQLQTKRLQTSLEKFLSAIFSLSATVIVSRLESELVAGFFTEHSSVPFVFFFLAEYSSIVLFSCITAIFFLGGYNFPELSIQGNQSINLINIQSIILGLKTCFFCFLFVWFRATLPRLRYDQLIEFCWLNLLPIIVAFIILVPSILVAFDIAPY